MAATGGDETHTVLFAPASNVLFHVGRSVVLAREMSRRGHRSVLAGTERYLRDPVVEATAESEIALLPDFDPTTAMELLRSIHRVPDRRLVESLIEAELGLLETLRPDLVVADFRPTLAISARLCGIPIASLLLSHWLPHYAENPEWIPRTYAAGALGRRLLGERIGRRVAAPVFRAIIRHKSTPFRAAARARGLPAPPLLWDYLQGDLNLLTDVEALAVGELPPHTRRVGPILWEPDSPLPEWWSRLERDRPVIFVNYGSTAHPELFRRTFEELGGSPWRVVVATCDQVEPDAFPIPENFFVERYLPIEQMVRRADLVIHHGGAGTFQQTLRAGTPGLVVATHWDQEFSGFLSEREDLGLFLTLREILARRGRLLTATRRMIENLPRHRERASSLKETLLACDGPKQASEALEAFLEARARGERPPGADAPAR
ncbi:MAG: nucleotide disphospho-sugar-binding domain-containing protein [Myxococcota bacterium]